MLYYQSVPDSPEYTQLMEKLGCFSIGDDLRSRVDDVDFFLFTGGPDVNPSFYRERNTHSRVDGIRDTQDILTYLCAARRDIPCVGICRGSQFLNVMCGGRMVQDIEGHALGYKNYHTIYATADTRCTHKVNSTHHQEIVLGEGSSCLYRSVGDDVVEAYTYPQEKVLGVQWHPEGDIGGPSEHLFSALFVDFLKQRLVH